MAAAAVRAVVLISGTGTNLQALIDARAQGSLALELSAVISNRPGAYGLQRAKLAGIPSAVLQHTEFASREAFDASMAAAIDRYSPDLVVLAGFMRILTPAFVRHYAGRLFNIHPSLLPKYPGLHTHRRALEAGEREHGATVHFVTEELDGGPAVVQARVAVLPGDDTETLAGRVREREHVIYPLALQWFAEGRLKMENNRAWLDSEPLPRHGHLIDNLNRGRG